MSQASTKIAASTAQRKAKPASTPVPRRAPEGGNANMPFTLERAARFCPTGDRMSRIEQNTGLPTPDAARLCEKMEEFAGTMGLVCREELGEGSEMGVSIFMRGLAQELVSRACLSAEMYDIKRNEALLAYSKFNESRDEDRDGPTGFDTAIAGKIEFANKLGRQAWAYFAMAEGAVSAFAHVTGEEWKPRERSNSGPSLAQRSLAVLAGALAD